MVIILKKSVSSKIYSAVMGGLIGFINSFFGSGGGLIAIPLLKKSGLEERKCHATSIAIILPLSIISAISYYNKGNIDIHLALKFIPAGILGAIAGSYILKKINNTVLKRIFGIVLIISGIRLFIK